MMRFLGGIFFCILFLLLGFLFWPQETFATHGNGCFTLTYSPNLQYATPSTDVTYTATLTNNCGERIEVFVWANASEFGAIQSGDFTGPDSDGWVYANTSSSGIEDGGTRTWSWTGKPNANCPLGNNNLVSLIEVWERHTDLTMHKLISYVSSPRVILYAGVFINVTNNSDAFHNFRVRIRDGFGVRKGPYTVGVAARSTGALLNTFDNDCTRGPFTIEWDVDGSGVWRTDSVTSYPPGGGSGGNNFGLTNGCMTQVEIVYSPAPPGSVCGNGSVEAGEQCDPPNGTTCSATCQTIAPPPPPPASVCGNGTVEAGEQCEPPNTVTCDANCQNNPGYCGDGTVQPFRGEQCEPPNTATCDISCQLKSSVCDCTPWAINGCGSFTIPCAYNEMLETRSCNNPACGESRCVPNPFCGPPTPPPPPGPLPPPPPPPFPGCPDGFCNAFNNETCSTCPQDCGVCPAPPPPPPPPPSVCETSCTPWTDGACGGRGFSTICSDYQRFQSRSCFSSACSTSDRERCVNDPACGAAPPPPGGPPPPPPPPGGSPCSFMMFCNGDGNGWVGISTTGGYALYGACPAGDQCVQTWGSCPWVNCRDVGPSSISGTVFMDTNEDGVHQVGEKDYKGPYTIATQFQAGPYQPAYCYEYGWSYYTCVNQFATGVVCLGDPGCANYKENLCGPCRLPQPPVPAPYCYPTGLADPPQYQGYPDYGYI